MSTNLMLGLGFWLGLPAIGLWLLRWARVALPALATAPVLRLCVVTVVGILAWSPVLLLAAITGTFSPRVFSAVGWLAFVAGVAPLRRALEFAPNESRAEGWLLATLLMATLAWGAAMPSEPVLVSRDQAIYLHHALSIARTGSLKVSSPLDAPGMEAAKAALGPALSQGRWWLPGIFSTAKGLVVQFPAQYTVWLAQAQGSIDIRAVLRLNALFGTLAAAMFYLLLRSFTPGSVTLAATLLFAVNPAQVWIERITLSEPLAQLAIWAMLFLLSSGIAKGSSRLGAAAGIAGAIAVLTRIDALLLLPLTLAACAFQLALDPDDDLAGAAWQACIRALLVGLVPVATYYLLEVRPYAEYNARDIGVAITLALVAGTLLWTASRWGPAMRARFERAAWVVPAFGIGLATLVLYALILRPSIAPFVTIAGPPDNTLLGMRDHREDSLKSVVAYVSLPVILFAAAGVFVVFRRIRDVREATHRDVLPFVVLFGCIAALLWRPGVSPDHFWGVRRFVPVVIPGLLFFGAIGFQAIRKRIRPHAWQVAISVAMATYCIVFLQRGNSILMEGREQRGLYNHIAVFAQQLPDGLFLMEDGGDLNVALWLGFGKAAVPVSLRSLPQQQALRNLQRVAGQMQLPLHVLGGRVLGFAGLTAGMPTAFHFGWTEIAPTLTPLADRWRPAQRQFYLHRVNVLTGTAMPALWGNERNWQALESGFHDEEIWGQSLGRWTDGDAMIAIPLPPIEPAPETLVTTLYAREPDGAHLAIEANGLTIFDERVPGGASRLQLPLPSALRGANVLQLRLKSNTFSPADTSPSLDRRHLGIFLFGVEVRRPDCNQSPREAASLSARIESPAQRISQLTSGKSSDPVVVRVTNSGKTTWNRDPMEDRTAIALGISWRRAGDGVRRLSERRVALPANVRPGEFVTVPVVLQATDDAGEPLPSGNYLVTIDMVAEHQAWFGDVGSQPLSLAIQIVR